MISVTKMRRYKDLYDRIPNFINDAFDIYARPSQAKVRAVYLWSKKANCLKCLGKNGFSFTLGGWLENGKFFVATKDNYGELEV